MSLHSVLVFVHVMSAMILSGSALISLFSLLALRRAERTEQARSILELVALSELFAGIALILTPTVGLIMTINTWGWQYGWINVALGSMILLLLPMGAVTGIRRRALAKLLKEMPDELLPKSVKQRIHDPVLGTAIYMMISLLFGIVFLMTTKPALEGSLSAIVASLILAVVSSFPLWRRRIKEEPSEGNTLTDKA
jgi:uncharacterized membrane protein